jgi:hypothetical protein
VAEDGNSVKEFMLCFLEVTLLGRKRRRMRRRRKRR